MSMPEFPDSKDILTRDQAINAILTSIAMEETALSHIITAESEKIQFAIKHIKSNCHADLGQLLEVNESASSLLEQVGDMQIILKNKLRSVVKLLPRPCPPDCPPPGKPSCTCTSVCTEEIICKNRPKNRHKNCAPLR